MDDCPKGHLRRILPSPCCHAGATTLSFRPRYGRGEPCWCEGPEAGVVRCPSTHTPTPSCPICYPQIPSSHPRLSPKIIAPGEIGIAARLKISPTPGIVARAGAVGLAAIGIGAGAPPTREEQDITQHRWRAAGATQAQTEPRHRAGRGGATTDGTATMAGASTRARRPTVQRYP